jgi:hypothetical protein
VEHIESFSVGVGFNTRGHTSSDEKLKPENEDVSTTKASLSLSLSLSLARMQIIYDDIHAAGNSFREYVMSKSFDRFITSTIQDEVMPNERDNVVRR